MTKIYYVCNRVDKEEIQCSTLEAAKGACKKCIDKMVTNIVYMYRDVVDSELNSEFDKISGKASELFYVKQVEYVREEVIYDYLYEELKDE